MIEINDMQTSSGSTVAHLNTKQPVLLLFLRQLGCMFCREAMLKLATVRQEIETGGTKIVIVHMATTDKEARKVLKKYKLDSCDLIADPSCLYYARFGLVKTNISQLFGLSSWVKTAEYGILKGHGFHFPIGDGFQLPGMFILQDGEIIQSFHAEDVYEQPPYEQFIACCTPHKPN